MRMISDEKRREVAATMRAISCRGVKDLTLGEVLNSILTGGAPRPTTEMAILARLADLIDRPTCKNSEYLYDGSFFECSECGERWELTCGSPADNNLNFCPRCGAEVAE